MQTMKKASLIILFLAAFVMNGCAGNNKPGNDSTNHSTETVAASAGENEGTVIYLSTEEFRKQIWDYQKSPDTWNYKGKVPCIIDFYADWCRPCRMVAPIMEELAKTYKGKVKFYKVNTDKERELSATFQIRSIPAIMYIPKEGKPQMSVGAQPKENYIQNIKDFLKVQ